MKRRVFTIVAAVSLLVSITSAIGWYSSLEGWRTWPSFDRESYTWQFGTYDSYFFASCSWEYVGKGYDHRLDLLLIYFEAQGAEEVQDASVGLRLDALTLLALIAPTWWCIAIVRARRLERAGQYLCKKCGYDLRASKDACPECGEVIIPATRK